jgi:ankyrin repeat protein
MAVPAAGQMFSNSYSFLKAVKERDGAKVQTLVSQPGSTAINAKDPSTGESALHIVTRGRDLAWLGFLLGKGARPDVQDRSGETPLGLAARIGWAEGADTLLSVRAPVDQANNRGETPLMIAVQRRDLPLVRLLLARGANPKRTDSAAGYSAIDYARTDGARSAAILKLLEAAPAAGAKKMIGPKL